MDFGIMSSFNNNNNNTSKILSHNEKQQHGSLVFTKQQRSDYNTKHKLDIDQQQHLFPTSKSLRSDYFDQPNKTMSLRSDSLLSVSAPNFDDADNNNNIMLSFSSSSNSNSNTTKDGASHFSFYQPPPSNIRNTGLQTGMHMPAVSRFKGPFTPSQWMELEHQALIYKYFVANVPVPSHLLTSLRKSLNTSFFPGSSSSISYAPNSYGWGTFHLGFSGNGDPEPGRCRRTDGKKWRCSRDAVPDQKYCERHINRGRHRSRKPVEGQNGHAVSSPAASKAGQVVSSSSVPISASRVSALAGATVNNHCTTLQHHNAVLSSSIVTPINRGQESQAFGINLFSIPKQHNTTEESSESLMYPTNCNSFLDQGAPNPNPLPNFIDEWSKEQSLKSDWTQLSMSIPMASDFSSSSNSPAQEKLTTPPLALTTEFDLDPTHKQGINWIPISWGNSMGGPLGEALNQTSGNSGIQSKNASSGSEMNQMNEMWDATNYHAGSSPTGVLQKTTFVSLSNSSSGSSPKGDKKDEYCGSGGSLCNELLVSTFAN